MNQPLLSERGLTGNLVLEIEKPEDKKNSKTSCFSDLKNDLQDMSNEVPNDFCVCLSRAEKKISPTFAIPILIAIYLTSWFCIVRLVDNLKTTCREFDWELSYQPESYSDDNKPSVLIYEAVLQILVIPFIISFAMGAEISYYYYLITFVLSNKWRAHRMFSVFLVASCYIFFFDVLSNTIEYRRYSNVLFDSVDEHYNSDDFVFFNKFKAIYGVGEKYHCLTSFFLQRTNTHSMLAAYTSTIEEAYETEENTMADYFILSRLFRDTMYNYYNRAYNHI